MRWKLIPVVFLSLFGVLFLLSSAVMFGVMVYFNIKLGGIADSGGANPTLDSIALSFRNILTVLDCFLLGGLSIVACRQWWQERYRLAVILTVLIWIGMGVLGALMDRNPKRKTLRLDKKQSQPVAMRNRLGWSCVL